MHEDKTEKNLREFVNHIAKLRVRVMNDKKDKREKVLREFGNHIEMLKQKYNIEQEDYSKIIALMSEFLFLLQCMIQLFVFSCRAAPRIIHCHAPIHNLIPFAPLLIIYILCVTNRIQHLVRIIIAE